MNPRKQRPSRVSLELRVLALGLLVGCSGEIPGSQRPGEEPDQGDPRVPPGSKPGGSSGGPAAAPGGTTTPGAPAGPFDPGPNAFRRLTNLQYANTVRAVLGVTVELQAHLGSDRSLQDFANSELQAAPSTGLCQAYGAAAAVAAEAAVATAARPKLFDAGACGDRGACLTSFVRTYGRRLFRRPVTEAELMAILKGANEQAQLANDFWAGARFALEVMLQSVPFLYIVDAGVKNDVYPELLRRDPHAIATRLSLLLWNSGPDDALLDLADKGGLRTTAEVSAQVTRMLQDPRTQETFRHFFREWLGYDLAPLVSKDAVHAEYKPELVRGLVAETDRLVDHFVGGNSKVMDIFNADFTFADEAVRSFYQAAASEALDAGRFRLPRERRGILGHASFIAANSGPGHHSPTLRGLGILKRFLCGDVGSPPPTAPAELPESEDNTPRTIRERTETFMLANPNCNYCHNHMDKVGFLFENFDAIGKFRTTEAVSGAPGGVKSVSAVGAIPTLGLERVEGLPGLAAALSTHEIAQQCLLKTLVKWSFGRGHLEADEALLAKLGETYEKAGGSFRSIVAALASSDALLYMRKAQ